MPTPRIPFRALAIAGALVALPALASAQLPLPSLCPRQPLETDFDWTNRCYAEQQQRDTALRVKDAQQRTAVTARQRAVLEKQPPLPAAKNRLLGRWETSTRPPAGGDPFAQLASMLTGCGVLLGDGIVEFAADRWAIYEGGNRNDMGAISYRAGTNGAVFGLPAEGSIFALLPFEFESPDQVRLVGVVCTLKRTSTAATAASPAAPAAAPAPRTSAATAKSPLEKFNFRRGYDCTDGPDVVVDRCTSEAPDGKCSIIRVDAPLVNGAPVTFTETVAAFSKRVAACRQRPLMFLDGKLQFAP